MKYKFELDGMQSMSHWQGVGVSGTEGDEVYTGYGNTKWDAACDAMDMLCQTHTIAPSIYDRMEGELLNFDSDVSTCDECGSISDGSCSGMDNLDTEECDNAWIVNLYVRW